MNLKEQLTTAFNAVPKKFKEGDKVKLRGSDLPFKVSKVNNVSYDLAIDLSEDEIKKQREILAVSIGWVERSFECWDSYIKKDTPFTLEEIQRAEAIMESQMKFGIEEKDIEKVVD
ncbi:hypothetical protein ACTOJ1_001350 [Shigella flexneri]